MTARRPAPPDPLAVAAVQARLRDGPAPLADIVARLEGLHDEPEAARGVSATLQAMARDGLIRLVNDGRRWTVVAA